MRAIWKGSIAFGLVHIPVNLYPATESQSTVSSNLLHKKDHSRIRYQRVSEATGKEVPAEEIVRGFEVERDNFVVISDDELKEAAPEKSAAIEIQEFVDQMTADVGSQLFVRKLIAPARGKHRLNRTANIELGVEQRTVHVEQVHGECWNHGCFPGTRSFQYAGLCL